jgi:hypothetical protein
MSILDIGTLGGRIELDNRLETSLDSAEEHVKHFGETFLSEFDGLAIGVGALITAITGLGASIVALGVTGSKINDVQAGFDRLSGSVVNADAILAAMRDGVKGTVNDLELMTNANRLMGAGIDASAQTFGTLTTAANILSREGYGPLETIMSTLDRAMQTGQLRRLAYIGVTGDMKAAEEVYANSVNATFSTLSQAQKVEAERYAMMQALNSVVAKSGELHLSFAQIVNQASTSIANWIEKLEGMIAASPDVSRAFLTIQQALVSAFGGDADTLLDTIVGWVNSFAKAVTTYGPTVVGWMVDVRDAIEAVYHEITADWNALPDWMKAVAKEGIEAAAAAWLVSKGFDAITGAYQKFTQAGSGGGGGESILGMGANLAQIASQTPKLTSLFGDFARALLNVGDNAEKIAGPIAAIGVGGNRAMALAMSEAAAAEAATGTAAVGIGAAGAALGAALLPIAAVSAAVWGAAQIYEYVKIKVEDYGAEEKKTSEVRNQAATDASNLARLEETLGMKFATLADAIDAARVAALKHGAELSVMTEKQRAAALAAEAAARDMKTYNDAVATIAADAAGTSVPLGKLADAVLFVGTHAVDAETGLVGLLDKFGNLPAKADPATIALEAFNTKVTALVEGQKRAILSQQESIAAFERTDTAILVHGANAKKTASEIDAWAASGVELTLKMKEIAVQLESDNDHAIAYSQQLMLAKGITLDMILVRKAQGESEAQIARAYDGTVAALKPLEAEMQKMKDLTQQVADEELKMSGTSHDVVVAANEDKFKKAVLAITETGAAWEVHYALLKRLRDDDDKADGSHWSTLVQTSTRALTQMREAAISDYGRMQTSSDGFTSGALKDQAKVVSDLNDKMLGLGSSADATFEKMKTRVSETDFSFRSWLANTATDSQKTSLGFDAMGEKILTIGNKANLTNDDMQKMLNAAGMGAEDLAAKLGVVLDEFGDISTAADKATASAVQSFAILPSNVPTDKITAQNLEDMKRKVAELTTSVAAGDVFAKEIAGKSYPGSQYGGEDFPLAKLQQQETDKAQLAYLTSAISAFESVNQNTTKAAQATTTAAQAQTTAAQATQTAAAGLTTATSNLNSTTTALASAGSANSGGRPIGGSIIGGGGSSTTFATEDLAELGKQIAEAQANINTASTGAATGPLGDQITEIQDKLAAITNAAATGGSAEQIAALVAQIAQLQSDASVAPAAQQAAFQKQITALQTTLTTLQKETAAQLFSQTSALQNTLATLQRQASAESFKQTADLKSVLVSLQKQAAVDNATIAKDKADTALGIGGPITSGRTLFGGGGGISGPLSSPGASPGLSSGATTTSPGGFASGGGGSFLPGWRSNSSIDYYGGSLPNAPTQAGPTSPTVTIAPGAIVNQFPIIRDPAAMAQLASVMGDAVLAKLTGSGWRPPAGVVR